jgi:hypothetical protein
VDPVEPPVEVGRPARTACVSAHPGRIYVAVSVQIRKPMYPTVEDVIIDATLRQTPV